MPSEYQPTLHKPYPTCGSISGHASYHDLHRAARYNNISLATYELNNGVDVDIRCGGAAADLVSDELG